MVGLGLPPGRTNLAILYWSSLAGMNVGRSPDAQIWPYFTGVHTPDHVCLRLFVAIRIIIRVCAAARVAPSFRHP